MSKKITVLKQTINCLNDLLEKSGIKNDLIKQSKESFIQTYETAVRHFPIQEVKNIMRISEQKIFKLKTSGRCNVSLSKNCLKLNPTQLCITEQEIIVNLLNHEEYSHLPINYIWAMAKRHGLYMSLNTFYKYAGKIGSRKKRVREHKEIKIYSPKASFPFQILHMDSTFWQCSNGERIYIHFIQDNFSRKILGSVVSFSTQSKIVAQNLLKVIKEYHLEDKTLELYCDDGPENKKYVDELLKNNNFKIKKVIANFSTRKSNNMIEAWNRTFKRIVLHKFKLEINSSISMKKKLPIMLNYFNNLYLPSLNTLSPNEVVLGKTYQDLENKIKTKQALEKRIKINKNICCYLKEFDDYSQYNCREVIQQQVQKEVKNN